MNDRRQVVANAPAFDAEAIMHQATVLQELGRWDDLLRCLQPHLNDIDEPLYGYLLCLEARICLKQTQPGISLAHEALARWPTVAGLHCQLGQLYLQAGLYGQARAALERAITIDPKSDHTHYLLSVLEFRQDRYAESRQQAEQAVRLSPSDADYRLQLAQCEWILDHDERAGDIIDAILRDHPTHSGTLTFKSRLADGWREKVRLLRNALLFDPHDGENQAELHRLTRALRRDAMAAFALPVLALVLWWQHDMPPFDALHQHFPAVIALVCLIFFKATSAHFKVFSSAVFATLVVMLLPDDPVAAWSQASGAKILGVILAYGIAFGLMTAIGMAVLGVIRLHLEGAWEAGTRHFRSARELRRQGVLGDKLRELSRQPDAVLIALLGLPPAFTLAALSGNAPAELHWSWVATPLLYAVLGRLGLGSTLEASGYYVLVTIICLLPIAVLITLMAHWIFWLWPLVVFVVYGLGVHAGRIGLRCGRSNG